MSVPTAQEISESLNFLQRFTSQVGASKSEGSLQRSNPEPFPPRSFSTPASRSEIVSRSVAKPDVNVTAGKSSRFSRVAEPLASLEFADVVMFLKRRYAANSTDEDELGLDSFSDADLNGLLECFGKELAATVHKARTRKILNLSEKRVNFAPKFSLQGTQEVSPMSSDGFEELSQPPTPSVSRKTASSSSSPMSMREAMSMMRTGEWFQKFGKNGQPAKRYLSVQDKRTLRRGEVVLSPHLCWSAAPDLDPSGQLPLIDLVDLHLGPSVIFATNSSGVVVDLSGQPISDRRCFTLVFGSREVHLAARREEEARLWIFALRLVLEKNKSVLRQAEREEHRKKRSE